jgi:hypothetical protein
LVPWIAQEKLPLASIEMLQVLQIYTGHMEYKISPAIASARCLFRHGVNPQPLHFTGDIASARCLYRHGANPQPLCFTGECLSPLLV